MQPSDGTFNVVITLNHNVHTSAGMTWVVRLTIACMVVEYYHTVHVNMLVLLFSLTARDYLPTR